MIPKERGEGATFRVCLAQIDTTVGDLEGNRQKILRAIGEARRQEAALVVFPEMTLTGYPPEDLLFQCRFITENLASLRAITPHTRGLLAILGFVDRDREGRLYNAAACLVDGRIAAVYHKVELPNYGVFDEKRYFVPGRHGLVIKYRGWRLGVTICEDIWQTNSFVYHKNYFSGLSALINLSASPFHCGKQKIRQGMVSKLVKRIKAPVIYQNLVGGQDELVFDGGSFVTDRFGKIVAQARRFEEDFLVVEVPRGAKTRSALLRAGHARLLSCEEEVYQALVLGTRDYVWKNKFKKALIGLSGGIDSALVARIAVDALGRSNVIGVTMPSRYNSRETYEDAKHLASNLGIRCLELRIDGILRSYLRELKGLFAGQPVDTTEENLQARIRGNVLMALSNKFGYLVLATGNKSEMATGYCTLYGDMAGGFAVIKDVPKTLVFRLARYRNSRQPNDSIPVRILRRAPSAELKFNQKDQDSLPAYSVLDRFLGLYVERDLSVEDILRRGIPKSVVEKVRRLVDRNEYKRRQAPPGVKITPKAFGRDRRMPITNLFMN